VPGLGQLAPQGPLAGDVGVLDVLLGDGRPALDHPPVLRSRAAARATASQSTRRWRQNRASSVSTTATRIHRLTFSSGTAVAGVVAASHMAR
jgi:hypothetical protein